MVSLTALPKDVVKQCVGCAQEILSPEQRAEILDFVGLPFVVAQTKEHVDSGAQGAIELEQLILFAYLSLAIATPHHSYPQFIFFMRFDGGNLEPVNPPIIGRDNWMTQWESYGSNISHHTLTNHVVEKTAAYFQALKGLRESPPGFSRILNAARFFWRALTTPETDWALGYAQLFTSFEAIFEVDRKAAGKGLEDQLLISPKLVWDPMELERGGQKINIKDLVKRAWALRNKVVHGDDPTKTGQQNEETVRDLALLVRKSLQRILKDKSLLKKLDDYSSAAAAIKVL
jgi:hypothetical protein